MTILERNQMIKFQFKYPTQSLESREKIINAVKEIDKLNAARIALYKTRMSLKGTINISNEMETVITNKIKQHRRIFRDSHKPTIAASYENKKQKINLSNTAYLSAHYRCIECSQTYTCLPATCYCQQRGGPRYKQKTSFQYQGNLKSIKDLRDNIKNQIKSRRQDLKNIRSTGKEFIVKGEPHNVRMFGGNIMGYVFHESGTFKYLLQAKEIKKIFNSKNPTTKDHYIGIELEFFTKKTFDELARTFYEAQLTDYLCIKNDGSIQAEKGYYATELAILCKESNYSEVINKVCEVLSKNDSKINKTCGMHVHLDMRNRDVNKCFTNLVVAQPILYGVNPKSRSNNKFCQITEQKEFKPSGNKDDRYHGINAEAYNKYQTLEIRIHAGTLNPVKINNWVKLLLCVVNTEKTRKNHFNEDKTFGNFIRYFDVDIELADYIAKRIETFNKDTSMEENN